MLLHISKTILVLLLTCTGYVMARHLLFAPNTWLAFCAVFFIGSILVHQFISGINFWRKKVLSICISGLLVTFAGFNYSLTLREHLPYKLSNPSSKEIRTLKAEVLEVNKTNKKISRALIRLETEFTPTKRVRVDEKALLYYQNDSLKNLKIGNKVLFNTQVEQVSNYNNPGEFDAKWFWENKGVTLLMFTQSKDFEIIEKPFSLLANFEDFRVLLNNQLQKVCDKKTHAVASALILGDKALLDRDTRNEFNTAGAMHVLAVSGLHVGILLLILELFFKQIPFLRKKKLYLLFALIALWSYAFLTGLSPSVIRATLMFTLLAIGQFKGKSMIGLNIIAFSAFVMLFVNPRYLFDIGFQLSYSAMFSISLFYLPIAELLKSSNRYVQKLWEGLSVCFAAQIGTIPLTLYYFHQFPNYFILTNLGLIILAFLCMAAGVAYLSLSFLPFINTFLGFILFSSFWLLIKFIEFIYSLPGALAKGFVLTWYEVAITYGALLLLHLAIKTRKTGLFYLSSSVLLIILTSINLIRLNKQNESHFAILNHNSPVILLNQSGVNYCFYDLLNKTNFDGTEYLVDSYSKYFGGEVEYINLKENNGIIKNAKHTISVKWDSHHLGYDIWVNNINYFLPTEEYVFKKDVPNILTRTLKYSEANEVENAIDLSKSYFRIPL